MTKNRLLLFLVIGLLLSNIILLFNIYNRKPPVRPKPREIIIERLNFDALQIAAYDKLIGIHQHQIADKEKFILKLKDALYSQLQQEVGELIIDSLSREIGKIQTDVEQIHFQHFEAIKSLCKKEQVKDFDLLIKDLARLFSRPPMKKPLK